MADVENLTLQVERVIPDFRLPSLDGRYVSPRDYKQRQNLVIVYLDPHRYDRYADLLREFADNYQAYRDLETEILAVCPRPISELHGEVGGLGLPFPVLSDERGAVGQVYLGSPPGQGPLAAIFVTDRFLSLRTQMVACFEGDLPNQETILDWLGLIEMECPECGPGDVSFQR